MELYIGGYAQGKFEYVKSKYPEAEIFDENNFNEVLKYWETDKVVICNHFHRIVKAMLSTGVTMEMIQLDIAQCIKRIPNMAVISDEVGNGIVPLEREEREFREINGRLLIQLAASAESVERIICGIPQKIK